jgi:hypothetical protein
MFASRLLSCLGVALNFLLLNAALLVASAFVVTIPLALRASFVALDRWRRDGEDRVLREFVRALRSGPWLSTTVVVGTPIVAIVVGVVEVRFFVRARDVAGQVCLGMGLAGLFLAVTSFGYVLLVAARNVAQPASDTWVLCTRLAIRNVFVTGPVFVGECVVVMWLSVADAAFVVFGSPLALVALMRLTAMSGARRAEGRTAPVVPEVDDAGAARGGKRALEGSRDRNLV